MIRLALLSVFCLTTAVATMQPAFAGRSDDAIAVLESDAGVFQKVQACRTLATLGDPDAAPALAALLDDPRLATDARTALQRIERPSAGLALVEALGVLDGDALLGVISSLGARREGGAVKALAGLTTSPDAEVAAAALAALGCIADHDATPVLLDVLGSGPVELREDAAAACLSAGEWYLQTGHRARAKGVFETIRKAPGVSESVRLAATCRSIVASGPAGAPVLRRLLRSGDRTEVSAALRLVRELRCEPTSALLGGELKRATGLRRDLLLQALRERDDPTARAAIDAATLTFVPLFDGKTFGGWEGDTETSFRIEDGAIVGGNLSTPIPRNEFLCTTRRYANFVLRLQCKVVNANGGVQFRTERVPGGREVAGYQADMDSSGTYWGCLYDESRRGMLVQAPTELTRGAVHADGWNDYEIRCEGPRIRLYLNDILTAEYLEKEPAIPGTGVIAVQVHAGEPSETWYRNIRIAELP